MGAHPEPPPVNSKQVDVAAAYDRAADKWRASRPEQLSPTLARLLELALVDVPPDARALDVGCGAGVPLTRALVSRGFRTTGLDFSQKLLEIARRDVPAATFLFGDMRTVPSHALGGAFDVIVAWDSVFHVPRADHAALFARFAGWLEPGGRILLSLGGSAWEGSSEMLGESFSYSGFEPDESLRLLERAGLAIVHSEIDDPQSRGHLAIIAVKGAASAP
jgi:cyclopropane fatty-acyl-phospholipid synthase-like methyltransferase